MKTIDELIRVDGEIHSPHLCRASAEWGGADVVITMQPPAAPSRNAFYPEPCFVVTELALELSWLFEVLRDAFDAENRLDGCSKIEFFGRLANTANRCLSRQPEVDAGALCSAVLGEAFAVYGEMEAGRFGCLPVAVDDPIADDSVHGANGSSESHVDIAMPEAIRRIADSEDRKLAWEFFVFFSRFEYALKRTPSYLKGGPKKAVPNWDQFGRDYDESFHALQTEAVCKAVEYFKSRPPLKQVVDAAGNLGWSEPQEYSAGPELEWVLLAIRAVRNNLFHGGKFPLHGVHDSSRDRQLLEFSIAILNACVPLDRSVASWIAELPDR